MMGMPGLDTVSIAQSLLLLLTANGAPVIACYLLGGRWAWPVDAGWRFRDGQPLLGESKTWRGMAWAITACAFVAVMVGYEWLLGLKFAVYAMLGDLGTSFIKRRLCIPPSGRATGLDQLPEALLPLILLRQELGLSAQAVVLTAAGFFVLELVLSRLLYRWHIRKHPY